MDVDNTAEHIEAEGVAQVAAQEAAADPANEDGACADAAAQAALVSESEIAPAELSQETQLEPEFVESLVQALVFASGEPLSVEQICAATNLNEEQVTQALEASQLQFRAGNFGFELLRVADKFQFRTKQGFANYLRELKADKPRRLSNAALETLAIIAYRQPIVRSDVEKIRGVDVTPTLKTLLERNLVKIVGHQQTVGQPALYGTTEDFLSLFGLESLGQLPTLRDISEFMKEPGEEPKDETAAAETTEPAEDAEAQVGAATEPVAEDSEAPVVESVAPAANS